MKSFYIKKFRQGIIDNQIAIRVSNTIKIYLCEDIQKVTSKPWNMCIRIHV